MFSDRYVDNVSRFNILFHTIMLTYYIFWGNKWWLIAWIPLFLLAVSTGLYGFRKRAMDRARKQ